MRLTRAHDVRKHLPRWKTSTIIENARNWKYPNTTIAVWHQNKSIKPLHLYTMMIILLFYHRKWAWYRHICWKAHKDFSPICIDWNDLLLLFLFCCFAFISIDFTFLSHSEDLTEQFNLNLVNFKFVEKRNCINSCITSVTNVGVTHLAEQI